MRGIEGLRARVANRNTPVDEWGEISAIITKLSIETYFASVPCCYRQFPQVGVLYERFSSTLCGGRSAELHLSTSGIPRLL